VKKKGTSMAVLYLVLGLAVFGLLYLMLNFIEQA
jgi:hypothetical protein